MLSLSECLRNVGRARGLSEHPEHQLGLEDCSHAGVAVLEGAMEDIEGLAPAQSESGSALKRTTVDSMHFLARPEPGWLLLFATYAL
jgi:hypothetical protein